MSTLKLILFVFALVLFCLAALPFPAARERNVALVAAGLAFFTGAHIFG